MDEAQELPPHVLARRWELVLPHGDRLLRIALARTARAADAEDVVQEAMVRCVAYPALDEARISSFLTTLTMRLCVDQHRQRARELRAGTAVFHGELADSGPEDVACDRDEAAWATRIAATLPERQWEALTYVARGADVAETARRMHLSYKAVESALSRARAVVRLRLASTLAALVYVARRSRALLLPVTTVTVASVAAVVIGSAGRQAAPEAELPWRAAAPVIREAQQQPLPTPRTPREGADGASRPAGGSRAAAVVVAKPAPRPEPTRVVSVPVPGSGPITVTHRESEDTVDKQIERCATSFEVTFSDELRPSAGCAKRPGEPGAYPISERIEDL